MINLTKSKRYNKLTIWLFNKHLLTCSWNPGYFNVIFIKKQWGITVKNLNIKPVIFPERFGLRTILRIRNYLIRLGK